MFDSETHYFDPAHSLPVGVLGSTNSYQGEGGGESSSVIIQDSNPNNNNILSDSNNNNNPNLNQSSVVAVANAMDFEQEALVHDHSSVQTGGAFGHSNNNWQHHQEMQDELQAEEYYQNNLQCFSSNPFIQSPTPDLLNLLHIPRCGSGGALPNSSISFHNNFHTSSLEPIFNGNSNNEVIHPSLHLNNLPPQPPIFRDLFQSLPQTYGLNGSGSSLFGGGMDDGDGNNNNGMRQFENSVLDFRRSKNLLNINGSSSTGGGFRRATKHFTTEKQRREQFNDKYKALSLLVPNPTKKQDRATVVQDAIEYIKELRRTVDELKILVDKKRCGSRNKKKLKTEEDMESSTMKPSDTNGPVRSSWLQRKSKETEVDVRIIDDDVTIKLIQRSKTNNLLLVSRIIDELDLDLLHVSGGCIGDHYSFWCNTKINEGSSVYASAIAKKLIEGVDKNYAASKPENN
ncbi:hypothetical protein MKX01_013630 [Papaver californicum]|nr:hypothetical protein MKX01_013630 [Papaver californicum]